MAQNGLIYEQIIQYIDGNIKNDITLNELSAYTGYSQRHLYKIFGIYSPVPIMTYIRNKKLYAAANEIYTGRNLYDVALDYGYETPAGFYKAFQTVFGRKPSEYKNQNQNYKKRRNIFMNIDNVKTIEELDEVLELFKMIYPDHPCSNLDHESDEIYGRKFWIEHFNQHPELLLYAKDDDKMCAFVCGWSNDGKSITINEGIFTKYLHTGIFEALFIEVEQRAKKLGFSNINLGIPEGQEEFYAKIGYTGKMLIQSEKHSIEALKRCLEKLNNQNVEITGENVYDDYINQIWLDVSILDTDLKKKFEVDLGDCWTQIIVGKNI